MSLTCGGRFIKRPRRTATCSDFCQGLVHGADSLRSCDTTLELVTKLHDRRSPPATSGAPR